MSLFYDKIEGTILFLGTFLTHWNNFKCIASTFYWIQCILESCSCGSPIVLPMANISIIKARQSLHFDILNLTAIMNMCKEFTWLDHSLLVVRITFRKDTQILCKWKITIYLVGLPCRTLNFFLVTYKSQNIETSYLCFYNDISWLRMNVFYSTFVLLNKPKCINNIL